MAKKKQPTIETVVTAIPGTIYVAAVQTIVEGVFLSMSIRSQEAADDNEHFECMNDPEVAYAFSEWLKLLLVDYPNLDIASLCDSDADPLVREIRLRK